MSWAAEVAAMYGESPNAVTVRNIHGQCSKGPRRMMDREVSDASGLTRLMPVVVLSLPTAHLSRTALDEVVTVTDTEGTVTTYVVRDKQLIEDGLVTRYVVVPQ